MCVSIYGYKFTCISCAFWTKVARQFSGTLQWSHGQWTPRLWKESRGFQQGGEVIRARNDRNQLFKTSRWLWMMKLRMEVVECSQGPKLTDSSWPYIYINMSWQKLWGWFISSKLTKVMFSIDGTHPIRCMMEGQKSQRQRQRREGNSNNRWFEPRKGNSWEILVKWDLILLKMTICFDLGVLLLDLIVFDS